MLGEIQNALSLLGQDFLKKEFLNNQIQAWLISLAIFVTTYVLFALIRLRVLKFLRKTAAKTDTKIDDILIEVISKTHPLFYFFIALFIASKTLIFNATAAEYATKITILLVIFQATIWVHKALSCWLKLHSESPKNNGNTEIATFFALGFLGKLILWTIAILLTLDNLGINISALVTGLGIGGIAVALAVQNILGDLIASLSIILDKPFVVGDFIIIDTHQGNVEHIGLKTTRIKSVSGEQIVFSNAEMLKARIRNYKHMQERRAIFPILIEYETPLEKIETLANTIKDIINSSKNTRLERVHFKEITTTGFLFECVYFVTNSDYLLYMDTQQAINLSIAKYLKNSNIKLAYPTQTIHTNIIKQL